jgi:hypothetical protein
MERSVIRDRRFHMEKPALDFAALNPGHNSTPAPAAQRGYFPVCLK